MAASARPAVPTAASPPSCPRSTRTRPSRWQCRSRPWWTAGWAMTGSTTARSGRTVRSSTPTSRKRPARTSCRGGPATTTPMSNTCARARPGNLAASHGLEPLEYWRAIASHPATTRTGRTRPSTRSSRRNRSVPMMIVCGLFDQEDIYGGPALFKALAPKDPDRQVIHLVLGPWNHGQGRREGRGIGLMHSRATPRGGSGAR